MLLPHLLAALALAILVRGAADADDRLDKLCLATSAELVQYDESSAKVMVCLVELEPVYFRAMGACNVKVYGKEPKSATETKAVMCPRDPDKITAFDTCLATKEIKVPSEDEREVAVLAMRECLMAPPSPVADPVAKVEEEGTSRARPEL